MGGEFHAEGLDERGIYGGRAHDVPQIPAPDDHYPTEFGGHPVEDYLPARDRLWVNAERTVMARLWASGTVEVAVRSHPSETWGPPFLLTEEK